MRILHASFKFDAGTFMRNQRLYWYSQRKNTLTSIVENINPFIQVSSVKMNYKELFNERSVANAMKRTLRSAKYAEIGIQNFHEIDGSQLVRHHRNEDNFFKDVAACVIGAPQELHRKTSAKYGTICYHLYRNKNQVMQGLFEGWFFFHFSIYICHPFRSWHGKICFLPQEVYSHEARNIFLR